MSRIRVTQGRFGADVWDGTRFVGRIGPAKSQRGFFGGRPGFVLYHRGQRLAGLHRPDLARAVTKLLEVDRALRSK